LLPLLRLLQQQAMLLAPQLVLDPQVSQMFLSGHPTPTPSPADQKR
jgi:hypothetical protein